jgi:hypothetical protein
MLTFGRWTSTSAFQADTGAREGNERRATTNRDEHVMRDIRDFWRFCQAGKRWKA